MAVMFVVLTSELST